MLIQFIFEPSLADIKLKARAPVITDKSEMLRFRINFEPDGMLLSMRPKSRRSGQDVVITIPSAGFMLRSLCSKTIAASPENCRSIKTASGSSERNKFSATNLSCASPTTLTLCSRSEAAIVASSKESSLTSKTRAVDACRVSICNDRSHRALCILGVSLSKNVSLRLEFIS